MICRKFTITIALCLTAASHPLARPLSQAAQPAGKHNVLFIAIDDLNDWLGCFGGHPQAITPNIDRLARRGVLFFNAHCAAPLCGPSRNAVFTGRQPYRTGMYSNVHKGWHNEHPTVPLLPKVFQKAGYKTFGTGKLLHGSSRSVFQSEFFPEQRWSPFSGKLANYTKAELFSKGTNNPSHVIRMDSREYVLPFNRMPSDRSPNEPKGESFDWAALDVADRDMGDSKITDWAIQNLRSQSEAKPFFMAVGYYRPHIPLYAPKKYFDLYDGVDIKLPPVREDDLEDLSPIASKWALEAVTAGSHATTVKHGQWQSAVRAYLACVTFIDAQVGRMLDVLDTTSHHKNTWVILWGDHGWHLGEKQHWGKWTGWQRSTQVPLLILPPSDNKGRFATNATCDTPVSLIDLYPTLVDLCGLKQVHRLDGQSLRPQLTNPEAISNRLAITTFDKGNYAISGTNWRYIRYSDGSEELYHRKNDPHEWINLAARPSHAKIVSRFAKALEVRLSRIK